MSQYFMVLQRLCLPAQHPLVVMFQIKTLNELHCPSERELTLCDSLLSAEVLPGSLWVMGQRARVLFHVNGDNLTS